MTTDCHCVDNRLPSCGSTCGALIERLGFKTRRQHFLNICFGSFCWQRLKIDGNTFTAPSFKSPCNIYLNDNKKFFFDPQSFFPCLCSHFHSGVSPPLFVSCKTHIKANNIYENNINPCWRRIPLSIFFFSHKSVKIDHHQYLVCIRKCKKKKV